MRIDCFPFFNEISLLKARLLWLSPHVDLFIISELDHTYSGYPKPYYLDQMDLPSNVIRLRLKDPFYEATPWQREHLQRDLLSEVIPPGKHLIHHSDVDEFPHPQVFSLNIDHPFHLQEELYYYNIYTRLHHFWNLPFICTELIKPSYMRHEPYPTIQDAGWHFSWFGTDLQIISKMKAFSHQELNTLEAQQRIVLREPLDPWDRPIPFERLREPTIPVGLRTVLRENSLGELL